MGGRARAAVAALALLLAAKATAQVNPLGGLRERARLPSAALARWFGGEAPITTSLNDAVLNAVPALDGFTPTAWSPLEEMPRAPGGTIWIAPGAYTFEAESYCIQPGTYSPHQGEGYLHANLEGPRAAIISRIVSTASDHPRIPQAEIQKLLWAILARARVDRLPASVKATAAAMLTPRELVELSSVGIPAVADATRRSVLASVPPATRQLLEAEDDLRRLLDGAEPSFEAMEQVAVLAGQAPPPATADRIPEGRWSWHPAGYFIRYIPITRYSRTRVQIYFPAGAQVRRDDRGRIVEVIRGLPEPPPSLWQPAGFRNRPTAPWQPGGSMSPWNPGSGGGFAPGQRQRGVSSGRQASQGGGSSNAVTKAQQMTNVIGNASTPLGILSGDLGMPGWMTGQLLNFNFQAALASDAALHGMDGGAAAAGSPAAPGAPQWVRARWTTSGPGTGWGQTPDYMTLSPPVLVAMEPVAPSPLVQPVHAAEGRKVRVAALQLAASLHALALARRRFVAASEAGRTDWVVRQGVAIVHLKHRAGGEMLLLADALDRLGPYLTPAGAGALLRAAQVQPDAQALSAESVELARALGVGEGEVARFRREIRDLDPERIAARAAGDVRALEEALREYGEYWLTLPVVAAPWG